MSDLVQRLRAFANVGGGHMPLVDQAADELERLTRELEESRKDQARLDYIAGNARCDPKMDGQHVWWPTSFNHRLLGPNLRAAIDAAMSQEK